MNKISKFIKFQKEIPKIIKFKQEITEHIDKCLEMLNDDITSWNINGITPDDIIDGILNDNQMKTLTLTITYYDRILNVYNTNQSDDDENEIQSENSDSDNLYSHFNSPESEDYSSVMENKVWTNQNNFPQLTSERDNYFGSDLENDNSVDPINYDVSDIIGTNNKENNIDDKDDNEYFINFEEDEMVNIYESDDDDDYLSNNIRKSLLPFVTESNIEVLDENIDVDYNEPII